MRQIIGVCARGGVPPLWTDMAQSHFWMDIVNFMGGNSNPETSLVRLFYGMDGPGLSKNKFSNAFIGAVTTFATVSS